MSRSRTKTRQWKWAILGALLAVNTALYANVLLDRAYVRGLAFGVANPELPDEKITRLLLDHVRSLPNRTAEELKSLPWLVRTNLRYNRLRPGPRTTLEYGRHQAACQVSARAFTALLDAHSIEWRPLTMHNSNLRGTHGTVEVKFERGWCAVDPLFGMIYRYPDRKPASLTDLKAHPELIEPNMTKAWTPGWGSEERAVKRPYPIGEDGYGFENAYRFSYHWFGPLRWWVRDTLVRLFGNDGPLLLQRPRFLRSPTLTLLIALNALAATIYVWHRLRDWRRRHGSPPTLASPSS